MLDLKFIRENIDKVRESCRAKFVDPPLDEFLRLDEERRKLVQELNVLQEQRNVANKDIGRKKQQGVSTGDLIKDMEMISQKISILETKVGDLDTKQAKIQIIIPNIHHESVPNGDSSNNAIIREFGQKMEFSFTPKDHIELGRTQSRLNMEAGSKLTGSGFAVFQGEWARLQRGLINFMLDFHTKKHGYTEIWPPALVNRQSMTGTGQLPKLEEDMYKLKDDDLFLIPTGEVPVTNLLRDELIEGDKLPLKYCAYTPCFRREAGSYGKDTKGLSRVHQFDKVELVKFVDPGNSLSELEDLVEEAEAILQSLELRYRVVLLASGDLSFAGAKCYDLEAWAPGSNRWFEVSSCSLFTDFQARRMNIRYKKSGMKRSEFVHTLNGSGVALARTVIALVETHQQSDGSIKYPKALEPYLT
ncbi:MAG: serine--tRNA ligase [Candidatus Omnitrophica bacterium]|nr:serine--tRNA ligase [Candidatus Omnitrophota bacterium]